MKPSKPTSPVSHDTPTTPQVPSAVTPVTNPTSDPSHPMASRPVQASHPTTSHPTHNQFPTSDPAHPHNVGDGLTLTDQTLTGQTPVQHGVHPVTHVGPQAPVSDLTRRHSQHNMTVPASELTKKYSPKAPARHAGTPYPKVLYRPRTGSVPLVDDTQTVANEAEEKAALADHWVLKPSPVPVDVPIQPLSAEEHRVLIHLIERLKPKKG